jgi:WD40 repeat protein
VVFSPDGRILATGNVDGTVRLWDTTDPAHPRQLSQVLVTRGLFGNSPDDTGVVAAVVAFSHDGRVLASDSDGWVRLWDTTDPAHPRQLGQRLTTGNRYGIAAAAVFSPDGRTLATANRDGTIWLWDATNPAHLRSLGQLPTIGNSSGSIAYAVAFSPDGRTLASGNSDGSVQMWDTTNPAKPRPLGQPLDSGSGAVAAVTFSPDGRTLASGYDDGISQLWNLNINDAMARVCSTAGDLTLPQWHDYISQLPYKALCPR